MSRFRDNRVLQALVLWLVVFWIIMAIKPLYPRDWLLENILVFVYAALLIGTYRRFAFSNFSYGLFTLFMTLHMIGAHFTYAETPIGFWIQELFNLDRNHYDRIVHFYYGLLIVYPFREILLRAAKVAHSWSYFLAVCGILAFSAFYEVLEMMAAMVVSPELGTAFLGTQGDEWDAQKDTGLAFAGALMTMIATRLLTMQTNIPKNK
jgi:putative membrane protein